MDRVDSFLSLSDWRDCLYRGAPEGIDRFLDSIDASLPPGWAREFHFDRGRSRRDSIRCYLYDDPDHAAVQVSLLRVSPTRVRGRPPQVLRYPPSIATGLTGGAGMLVAEFAGACVIPAAVASGVRCTRPRFGPRSALTTAAEMMFVQFADPVDGEWPLALGARASWDELISSCLSEQVGIDRGELCRWFEDNGWEPDAASALADGFFADSEWLARQLAVMAR